jgi:hypothetical protein
MTYEQAFADHQYLWSIDDAKDMTGAYVDQRDLERLLAAPNKATAKRCLRDQIHYWFQAGTESKGSAESIAKNDPRVKQIAERHGVRWNYDS